MKQNKTLIRLMLTDTGSAQGRILHSEENQYGISL